MSTTREDELNEMLDQLHASMLGTERRADEALTQFQHEPNETNKTQLLDRLNRKAEARGEWHGALAALRLTMPRFRYLTPDKRALATPAPQPTINGAVSLGRLLEAIDQAGLNTIAAHLHTLAQRYTEVAQNNTNAGLHEAARQHLNMALTLNLLANHIGNAQSDTNRYDLRVYHETEKTDVAITRGHLNDRIKALIDELADERNDPDVTIAVNLHLD